MLEILTAPNPILSGKAKSVAKIDKATLNLLEEMKKSLEAASDPVGVGLAAPQIGKSLKIFIAKPSFKSEIYVFINPRIIKTEKKEKAVASKIKKLEGCLSLPSIWGEVKRFQQVTLEYEDANEIKHKKKYTGFMATIIQHEMDHLSGVLFPKRVLEQKGILYKSEKDEKGEDVFEEIKV
ncbi:MAG TPA: peptide deformylase [Candidatus Sulfotelmatobacter sp.]|nr:peptide deformylase [Candidatus Sulfotelmatobacter sp.]